MKQDAAAGRQVSVIAHRGASREHPENTLAAFGRAVELRADWVELDVRRSADGRLVVHHDAVLPDGRLIVSLPRRELPGSIPELADALRACRPLGVNIEVKNSPSDVDFDPRCEVALAVAELVATAEFRALPILVSSFDPDSLAVIRARPDAPPTALLTFAGTADAAIARCVADGHAAWHPYHQTVDRDVIERAHAKHLLVNVWTVDDPLRMRELLAFGVDGICTNVPDVARAVVDEAGGNR